MARPDSAQFQTGQIQTALNLARALAWTTGVVMILAAVAFPFAHAFLHVRPFQGDLEAMAAEVVERQQSELVRREQFDPAAALKLAAADPRIEAEARVLGDGRLLVRTMTSAAAITNDWLPAMIFERTVDPDGKATEGAWLID